MASYLEGEFVDGEIVTERGRALNVGDAWAGKAADGGLPQTATADARAIVDSGIDRYIAARHARVGAFVDANYALAGSLRLHRQAFGRDLLRAPANVALALPNLLAQLAAAGLSRAGARDIARRVRAHPLVLETDVARELTWRFYADFLELPYDDGERRSERDALSETILADPRLARAIDGLDALAARADADAALRSRLRHNIDVYVQARTASAELANSLLLGGVGAVAFKQLTPGAMSLGPVVATAVVQHAAIANFPLGVAVGSAWYALFPAAPSVVLVAAVSGGLIGVGALLTALAGVITDPVQRTLGVHSRRLHRFVDGFAVELKGGSRPFQVRDHYAARVFDLLDLAKLAAQVAR